MEDKLASKQDMNDFKVEMRRDFKELETRIVSEFKLHESKLHESKLTIRMGTMLAASIAIITAIQKLV